MRQNHVSEAASLLCVATACCHNVTKLSNGELAGNEVETEMVKFAARHFTDDNLLNHVTTLKTQPFDQATQMQAVLVKNKNGQKLIFAKGSPKALSQHTTLGAEFVQTRAAELASDGFYVLAVGYRELTSAEEGANYDDLNLLEESEKPLHFLGFLVFRNPLKPDSKEVIQELMEAGIQPTLLTGDNIHSGLHVAEKAGVVEGFEVNPLRNGQTVVMLDTVQEDNRGQLQLSVKFGGSSAGTTQTKSVGGPTAARELAVATTTSDGMTKIDSIAPSSEEQFEDLISLDSSDETAVQAFSDFLAIQKFLVTTEKFDPFPLGTGVVQRAEKRRVKLQTFEELRERAEIDSLDHFQSSRTFLDDHARAVRTELESSSSQLSFTSKEYVKDLLSDVRFVLSQTAFDALKAFDEDNKATKDKKTTPPILPFLAANAAVFGSVTPAGKVSVVKYFQDQFKVPIGMCGDGGNDSCAVRQADFGMALTNKDLSKDEESSDASELQILAPFCADTYSLKSVVTVIREARACVSSQLAVVQYSLVATVFILLARAWTNNYNSAPQSEGSMMLWRAFIWIPTVALILSANGPYKAWWAGAGGGGRTKETSKEVLGDSVKDSPEKPLLQKQSSVSTDEACEEQNPGAAKQNVLLSPIERRANNRLVARIPPGSVLTMSNWFTIALIIWIGTLFTANVMFPAVLVKPGVGHGDWFRRSNPAANGYDEVESGMTDGAEKYTTTHPNPADSNTPSANVSFSLMEIVGAALLLIAAVCVSLGSIWRQNIFWNNKRFVLTLLIPIAVFLLVPVGFLLFGPNTWLSCAFRAQCDNRSSNLRPHWAWMSEWTGFRTSYKTEGDEMQGARIFFYEPDSAVAAVGRNACPVRGDPGGLVYLIRDEEQRSTNSSEKTFFRVDSPKDGENRSFYKEEISEAEFEKLFSDSKNTKQIDVLTSAEFAALENMKTWYDNFPGVLFGGSAEDWASSLISSSPRLEKIFASSDGPLFDDRFTLLNGHSPESLAALSAKHDQDNAFVQALTDSAYRWNLDVTAPFALGFRWTEENRKKIVQAAKAFAKELVGEFKKNPGWLDLWKTASTPVAPGGDASTQKAAAKALGANLENLPFASLGANKISQMGLELLRSSSGTFAAVEGAIKDSPGGVDSLAKAMLTKGNGMDGDPQLFMELLLQLFPDSAPLFGSTQNPTRTTLHPDQHDTKNGDGLNLRREVSGFCALAIQPVTVWEEGESSSAPEEPHASAKKRTLASKVAQLEKQFSNLQINLATASFQGRIRAHTTFL